MENLAGEVVFITGGAQGIGLALARAFLAEGAAVAVADVDPGALGSAHAELTKQSGPGSVLALELDVRDRDTFACAAEEVEARLGAVSVLCNNAGIRVPDALPQLGYDL